MEKAVLLIQLQFGGYVVKQHDPNHSMTKLLFAGTLEGCLKFIQEWMEKE